MIYNWFDLFDPETFLLRMPRSCYFYNTFQWDIRLENKAKIKLETSSCVGRLLRIFGKQSTQKPLRRQDSLMTPAKRFLRRKDEQCNEIMYICNLQHPVKPVGVFRTLQTAHGRLALTSV